MSTHPKDLSEEILNDIKKIKDSHNETLSDIDQKKRTCDSLFDLISKIISFLCIDEIIQYDNIDFDLSDIHYVVNKVITKPMLKILNPFTDLENKQIKKNNHSMMSIMAQLGPEHLDMSLASDKKSEETLSDLIEKVKFFEKNPGSFSSYGHQNKYFYEKLKNFFPEDSFFLKGFFCLKVKSIYEIASTELEKDNPDKKHSVKNLRSEVRKHFILKP